MNSIAKISMAIVLSISLLSICPVSTRATSTDPSTELSEQPVSKGGSSWSLDYYLNDFNEPTDEAYIKGGPFTGTADLSDDITAYLFCDGDRVWVKLFQYSGSVSVRNATSYDIGYRMSIKAYFSFDGTKDEKSLYNHIFYCEGNMTSHDEAIIVMPGEYSDFYTEDYSSNIDVDVNGIQYKTVTDVLKNSVEVIFSIYQTDAPAYKYVVSISNSDGFADALEQLKSNNIDVEVGTRVHHKDYGDATVTDIVREDGKRLAILEFDDNDASIPKGQYRIEIPWGFHAGVLSLISSPQQNVNHIEDDAFIKEILLSGTWFYIENKDNWWKFNGDGSGQLTDFADFSWSVDKGVLSIDWSFSEAISQYYLTEEGGSYYLCSIEDTKKCASLSK